MKRIDDFVQTNDLITKDSTVIVAVSTGVDSMLLLEWLLRRESLYNIQIVVAHAHHGLRDASNEELSFIRHYCEQRHIKLYTKYLHVHEQQKANNDAGKSVQQLARELRYQFFEEVMEKERAHYIMTGHHGDDQVETVLMRVTRGYSGGGLGIPKVRAFGRGQLVRPLLCLAKEDIYELARAEQISWCEDVSNEDQHYTRNRFRQAVLPKLKDENRRLHVSFQHFVDDYEEQRVYIEAEAEKILQQCVFQQEEGHILHIHPFRIHPIPLQRRAFHLLLNYLYRNKNVLVSRVHSDQCLRLLHADRSSAEIQLPEGLKVSRSYDQIRFTYGQPFAQMPQETVRVNEWPTVVQTSIGAITFEQTEKRRSASLMECHIPMEHVTVPLFVRSRLPGDVIQPQGMTGTQKVKQVFIDQKIPKEERASWPIITDDHGQIIWIPKLKKSTIADEQSQSSYIRMTIQRTVNL
ncbi:tRNA lysidine(34) synthetase TilS [Geomicrobium sp. JSM 1781026]|uniref:tRNA lysidine(34) synthetase TilS n=1 Tax=Geomicrobium sp. JSM 1781026 TaxID=3344580 RepID=UPI0035BF3EA7